MPDSKQFNEDMDQWKRDLVDRGRGAGPAYAGDDAGMPLVWHDQIFGERFEPSGSVHCERALRAGRTQNSLDVILVASVANEEPLLIPAGATITATFMTADSEEGVFEEVGPSICVRAPQAGMEIEPGALVCRFAAGNFRKPWLMVRLEFSGSITGGLMDCGLGYVPR